MARVLIVYGTTEGHTARVAVRIAAAVREGGHEVDLREAKEVRKAALASDYDGIVVGGSIHAGEYQTSVREFAKRNREVLERTPSAFFSVSLTAADPDEEAAAETKSMLEKFYAETGWRPKRVEVFAGALVYTQYNVFVRHMMKLIVKRQGQTALDTSRDYDFTDWDAVDRFGREFAAGLRVAART